MTETIISSSVLIVFVIAFRRLLKGGISLRLQYALWALVALRLLLPFSVLNSRISVMNAVSVFEKDRTQTPAQARYPILVPYLTDKSEPIPQAVFEISPEGSKSVAQANEKQTALPKYAMYLWAFGVFVLLSWFVGTNIHFRRRLKKNSKPELFPDCPLPVYSSPMLLTPCLLSVFRPSIYLSPDSLRDPVRMEHILAHELTHYVHKDHIWAFLRAFLIAFYWFNPLVWIAGILSRRDCELACDEGTLQKLGDENRIEYGKTLIRMMTMKPMSIGLLCLAATMDSGASGIKERIALIARKPKMLAGTAAVFVLFMALAAACTFTGAKGNEMVPVSAEEPAAVNEPASETVTALSLDSYLSEAILAENEGSHVSGEFQTESHVTLKTVEDDTTAVVYLRVYYAEYDFPDGNAEEVGGSHIPCVLTFSKDKSGAYALTEYWRAKDGSEYGPSIREKFPEDIVKQAMDTQRYVKQQKAACDEAAQLYLVSRKSEKELVHIIASSPAEASNPYAYIEAHRTEYDVLVSRGDTALRYIFGEFLKGGQTGLEGHILRAVCGDILDGEDMPLLAATGQEWFNEYLKHVKQLRDKNSDDFMEKYYPKAHLLLEMADERKK